MPCRLLLVLSVWVPMLTLPGAETSTTVTESQQRITFKGEMTLNDALAAFSRQTKVQVVSDLGENPTIKLDLKAATFWQALDAIAEAAGARLYLYRPDGKIALVKKNKNASTFISSHGIFRVALRRVSTLRDFETGANNYIASLEVAWEPTTKPLYLETQPQHLVLRNAENLPIKVGEPTSVWAPIDGKLALPIDIVLPSVPRSSPSLRLLKGTLPIRLPSKMLTLTFDTLDRLKAAATAPTLTETGVTCSLTQIRLGKTSWTVQTTIKIPQGGPKFESFQTWAASNEIYLLSKDGKRTFPSSNYALESSSSDKVVISYNFEDSAMMKRGDPEDWKVVCRVPASILEMSIPFEFKDVPLP